MSLAAGIVSLSPEMKDIANTVLRRTRQHTLSSAQAAANPCGNSGAPMRICMMYHVRRNSLSYWKSCAGQSSALERGQLMWPCGQNLMQSAHRESWPREGRKCASRRPWVFERIIFCTFKSGP